MKLIETYRAYMAGGITIEQAATALGVTPLSLKIRLTKHGDNIEKVLQALDDIAEDKITRQQATQALGIDVRSINHLMKSWNVTRPIKAYALVRATSLLKWEVRKKFSTDFIAGRITIEQAALLAGVSERQIRRWASELLQQHLGMVYKDLKALDHVKLQRIAKHIVEAEDLTEEARRTADEVSVGKKTLDGEAYGRVVILKEAKSISKSPKKP
jgi:hypothetical protein